MDASGPAAHATASEVEFRSLDGTVLRGTFVRPVAATRVVIFVHGGGVTRDEGGFFARAAHRLAGAGTASLRFDLRGHGLSGGDQAALTLSGVVNDIRSAADYARRSVGIGAVGVISASFGGGVSAMYAARYPDAVHSLVLINPLLDYKRRLINEKPYWSDDRISVDAAETMDHEGFVRHSPTFKLGRPLLNELFFIKPREDLANVKAPTLIIHGTSDTFISVESSRACVPLFSARVRLVEVEGAQHGIAVHDDPGYEDPRTQAWQATAIDDIVGWLNGTTEDDGAYGTSAAS